MNYNEIKKSLEDLNGLKYELDVEYSENGGEITESTEAKEHAIAALKEMLLSEQGIDELGRWLMRVESDKTMLKAEKDTIERRIKACERTVDFIKYNVNRVLMACDKEQVKGSLYGFKASSSEKTSVEKDKLKELFQEAVEKALRKGRKPVIPEDVKVSLDASVSMLPEGAELPGYYKKTVTPSCTFNKPRPNQKKKEAQA